MSRTMCVIRWTGVLLVSMWLGVVGVGYAAASASGLVAVPPLTHRVTDLTATLSVEQSAQLEQQLGEFERTKGSQIAVLLIPTTQPETIEQYSIRVADQWKLGRKKIDDGVLLLVAKNDRTLRLEVGYGLEGALNDAVSKRIISEVITPHFKEGHFYQGIQAGVGSVINVINGEPLPDSAGFPVELGADKQAWVPVMVVVAVVLGQILRLLFGRVRGALVTSGILGVVAWWLVGWSVLVLLAMAMGFVFTLGGGRGMLPGYGGRGGSGGGFGGGGGGFGGGGSSGRW